MNKDKDITKKKSFIYECKELNLEIKFYKKINKTNFIYYECSKRRYGCNGTYEYNKKEKKFYHYIIDFEDFYKHYKDCKLDKYNMTFRKYQEYYDKAIFLNNEIIQKIELYKKFKEKFKIDLNLNNNEISTIKHYTIGKYNKLDKMELCQWNNLGKELLFKVNFTNII